MRMALLHAVLCQPLWKWPDLCRFMASQNDSNQMEFTITDANFFETVTEADVLDGFEEHNLIGDEQFRELAKALEEHLLQCSA